MNKNESQGFFCVVYLTDDKKTVYYHKVWNPSKLAKTLKSYTWIKVFIDKQTYHSNTKTTDYFAIYKAGEVVPEFTFKPDQKN